jgi:hypothetical protein
MTKGKQMNLTDIELANVNKNIIRLTEFIERLKVESIILPKAADKEIAVFMKYPYGFDGLDIKSYEELLGALESTHLHIKVHRNDLNMKIFKNILNDTIQAMQLNRDSVLELSSV